MTRSPKLKQRDRLPLWFSLAMTDLRANPIFTASFILNLSLGLFGLMTINSFKDGIERQVAERSQSALGADLIVSASRALSEEEIEHIRRDLPQGSGVRMEDSLLTMISTPEGTASKLVEIRGIDESFPFYGTMKLTSQGNIQEPSPKDILGAAHVWAPKDLLIMLGKSIGENVQIGHKTFKISDTIEQDPQTTAQGFSIAPRVYLGRSFLAETGLLAFGTRRWQSLLIKLPPGVQVESLAQGIKERSPSADIAVKTHSSSASDLNRAVAYLGDYLGLVALVAVFLAAVGGIYLFQGHLARKAPDMAILLSLGMSHGTVANVYLTQLTTLALIAVAIAMGLSIIGLPLLPTLLTGLIPPDLKVKPSLWSLLWVSSAAMVANILACAPLLLRLRSMKPSLLFQESAQLSTFSGMRPWHGLVLFPAWAFYAGLAVWQSHSIKIGLIFVGLLTLTFLILAVTGRFFTKLALHLHRYVSLPLEMAFLRMGRQKIPTLTTIAALGLASLLLTLIPLLEKVLQEAVKTPETSTLPSLFLLDVQEDQAIPLRERIEAHGAKLGALAPLIRARLLEVNGKPITEITRNQSEGYNIRESEEAERTIHRGFNLSYREGLAEATQLVKGRSFSGPFTEQSKRLPEISLEVRFAERMKFKLGDVLKFEVQGVPIEGEVINLRKVTWTTFQPNFFIEFQPGVLNDAPKTFVGAASISSLAEKQTLQKELVLSFPNVTAIDVTAVMERLLGTANQMSRALSVMAILALFSGLGVLFAITRTESVKREADVVLLKSLGVTFGSLRLTIGWEFAFIGLIASLIGGTLASLGAYFLAQELFESSGMIDVKIPLMITAIVTVLCALIGILATEKTLRLPAYLALGRKRFGI